LVLFVGSPQKVKGSTNQTPPWGVLFLQRAKGGRKNPRHGTQKPGETRDNANKKPSSCHVVKK